MKPSKLHLFFFFSLLLSATPLSAQSANMKTAMDGYAKFASGDIAGIIATLSPKIVWKHAGDPKILPFAGTFEGHEGMVRFFEAVGKTMQISVFNPTNFREKGNNVTNDCRIEGIVIATGKSFSDDLIMTWSFGPNGEVLNWEATGSMASITAASLNK